MEMLIPRIAETGESVRAELTIILIAKLKYLKYFLSLINRRPILLKVDFVIEEICSFIKERILIHNIENFITKLHRIRSKRISYNIPIRIIHHCVKMQLRSSPGTQAKLGGQWQATYWIHYIYFLLIKFKNIWKVFSYMVCYLYAYGSEFW